MSATENEINREIPVSLYYQLKEELFKKISSRKWLPGAKIPSEKALCEMYGVSRITVRKALDMLVSSGHLVRRQGKGTFVTDLSLEQSLSKFYSFSEELKQRGMDEHIKVIYFDQVAASGDIAWHLGLEPFTSVFKLTRLRMVDLTPYTLESSYIPVKVCPALTQASIAENGLYDSMRANGVYPDRVIEKFRATIIRKVEAELMNLKTGMPAMQVERVTYSGSNTIEYCSSIVRGDFFTYTVELK